MIRAYVVDDEELAVQRLTRLLAATGRVEIVGTATDPEAAVEFLRVHPIDVLFLDIQMPGLTGFELIERLDQEPVVVFTTAYDQYAIDAFAVNSVDYLLKPIEPDRLARALDKLDRFQGGTGVSSRGDPSPPKGSQIAANGPNIRALARELAAHLRGDGSHSTTRPVPLLRLASRVGERTTLLDVAKITHFVAKDKLTFAVVAGHEHVVDHTLAELEERLDRRRFVRIHRATLVNVAFVDELHPAVDSGLVVRLKNDRRTELSVARDRVRELKSRLGI